MSNGLLKKRFAEYKDEISTKPAQRKPDDLSKPPNFTQQRKTKSDKSS